MTTFSSKLTDATEPPRHLKKGFCMALGTISSRSFHKRFGKTYPTDPKTPSLACALEPRLHSVPGSNQMVADVLSRTPSSPPKEGDLLFSEKVQTMAKHLFAHYPS
ncbi:hypothetical protein PoB_003687800 [Plakobranchus ocellatus]|uniref:Uncharacterized protein n=1 Tax=Plakobranchus ocellatus TaxID=259542 RepID=A0AAV4ASL9_9GAST|nr:hypothetical protein PoB_003687800 [Plakobranchus ocellatus]